MGFDGSKHEEFGGLLDTPDGGHAPATLPHMSSPRVDWYGATVPNATDKDLIELVVSLGHGLRVGPKQKSQLQGRYYKRWVTLWNRFGPCAQVHWAHSNSAHPRIDVWGPMSWEVALALRARYTHFVTRMDSCCDTENPHAYRIWKKFLEEFAAHYSRELILKEETETRRGETASTLYVGSKNSEVRLCLYVRIPAHRDR